MHTASETSGYGDAKALLEASTCLDLIHFDIKHLDPEIHKAHTGFSNDVILKNLKKLDADGVGLVIRVPVVPGYNDSEEHIQANAEFCATLTLVKKVELLDILSFWEGRGFYEMTLANLSEQALEAEKAGVLSVGSRITSTGHVVPNSSKVLSIGLNGIIEEAKAQIASFDSIDHEALKKIDFLKAIIISCESVVTLRLWPIRLIHWLQFKRLFLKMVN